MNIVENLKPPLYVDLDGTFSKTDMLFESLMIALKNNPLVLFMCIFWLVKGKSYLKYKLSQRAEIAIETLPLNEEFYLFLLNEKEKNRKIILATASNEKYAKNICDHYDLFDSYISSDEETNLKGKTKLLRIKSLSEKYSYAGNSSEDFAIFEQAEDSYLVNPTRTAKKMASNIVLTQTFDRGGAGLKVWSKQLRIHQWLKNLLIFVPLLVSGSFTNINLVYAALIGFVSFGCLASVTYIINDLLDLNSDRNHVRKKYRPLAAGSISIMHAQIVAAILFVFAFAMAYLIDGTFIFVLLGYLVLTLLYSFKLKQYVGIDVITLSTLYTVRIIAGAVILDVIMSFWLLSFSMFVFFSLALVKRCAELKALEVQDKYQTGGRDYNIQDYPILMNLGISSAMLSVLTICFYVNNNALTNQYQEPTILWLIIPTLSYWLIRMWIKTHRGEMHDDPIVFSLNDRGSLITVGLIVLTAFLAQVI